MVCKHELKDLVGMADGIHCLKCGAVLNEMPKKEGDDGKLADNESSKPAKERKRSRRPSGKITTD